MSMRASAVTFAFIVVGIAVVLMLAGREIRHEREKNLQRLAECERRGPSEAAFIQSAGVWFEHPQYHEMLGQFGRLTKGLSPQQVEGLLGKPSYVEALASREGNGFNGCNWTYVLKARTTEGRFTQRDLINITFDAEDRLADSFHEEQE